MRSNELTHFSVENPDELQININECIEIIEEYDDGMVDCKYNLSGYFIEL